MFPRARAEAEVLLEEWRMVRRRIREREQRRMRKERRRQWNRDSRELFACRDRLARREQAIMSSNSKLINK